MNNIEDENLNTYIIPLNYNVPGKWHNISIPNFIEGAILAAIVDIPILSIPFTFQFKFILLILCSTGLVAFALVGINGERISSFMLVALKYLLKLLSQKTVYHMRKVGVQSIETSQNRNTGNTSRAEKLISKLRQIKKSSNKEGSSKEQS